MAKENFKAYLKKRKKDSNKGDYGRVFIIAGSVGYTGAAYLCAKAAMRSGSGLVTLGIPEGLCSIMEIKLTEVIKKPLPQTDELTLSLKAKDEILKFSQGVDSIAIGPGLSRHEEVKKLVKSLILQIDKPTVIDADGINALADKPEIVKKAKCPLILTPHPGEMSRIAKIGIEDIQRNREEIALSYAQKLNVVLVLKGYKTVIATPEGKVYVNMTGNPGMASAGTGDVLTGMIASFLGQGLEPFKAAKLGVYLHGAAGDLVAKEKSQASLIAEDLIEKLPTVFKLLGK